MFTWILFLSFSLVVFGRSPVIRPGLHNCSCTNSNFHPDQESGSFHSPNFPYNYCPGFYCEWTILAGPPDSAIRVEFEHFDLRKDVDGLTLSVRENEKYLPIDLYTGKKSNLRDFVSGPNQSINFKFRSGFSSESTPATGFLIKFQRFKYNNTNCACPKLYHQATKEWQNISSPNYPEAYCPNMRCYYLLGLWENLGKARINKGVELKFDKIQLQNMTDRIYIYEMDNPLMPKESRTRHSEDLGLWLHGQKDKDVPYMSKAHHVLLVFVSDNSNQMKGWHAQYRAYALPCECKTPNMTGGYGRFATPGFPDYRCMKSCDYSLQAPAPDQVLKVNFQLDDKGYYGQLKWLDANNSTIYDSWKQGGMPDGLTTNGPNLTLQYSQQQWAQLGFRAAVTVIKRPKNCQCPAQQPLVIERESGEVTSPGNSQSYCGPLDCVYNLQAPNGTMKRLVLQVDLDLASHDYLSMATEKQFLNHLGQETGQTFLDGRKYKGKMVNTTVEYDGVQQMYLHFHADQLQTTVGLGFNIRYVWKQSCFCGQTALTASTDGQILTSPLYPNNYCNGLHCQWLIQAPHGYRIVFEILEQQTALQDTLIVYDGNWRQDWIYSKSGKQPRNQIVRGSHHYLLVVFASDGIETDKGFKASFYAESWKDIQNENESSYSKEEPWKQAIIQLKDQQTSSGWTVAGPIFLAITFLLLGCLLMVFLLRNYEEKVAMWLPGRLRESRENEASPSRTRMDMNELQRENDI